MKQRSPEWYEARRGKLTASRIGRIMGGKAPFAELLRVIERELKEGAGGWLEGQDQSDHPNMAHGRDQEPVALAMYAMLYDVELEEVGFIDHPTLEGVGASPDAIQLEVVQVVREGTRVVPACCGQALGDGSCCGNPIPELEQTQELDLELRRVATVEVKCPVKLHRHQAAATRMPAEHAAQVQAQMFCAGLDQARFLSYFADTAPELQLYVHRVDADPVYHARLAEQVARFWRVFRGEEPLTTQPPVDAGIPRFF